MLKSQSNQSINILILNVKLAKLFFLLTFPDTYFNFRSKMFIKIQKLHLGKYKLKRYIILFATELFLGAAIQLLINNFNCLTLELVTFLQNYTNFI